jgi:hypothetical protein
MIAGQIVGAFLAAIGVFFPRVEGPVELTGKGMKFTVTRAEAPATEPSAPSTVPLPTAKLRVRARKIGYGAPIELQPGDQLEVTAHFLSEKGKGDEIKFGVKMEP